jgi:hypothetical protein
MRLPSSPSKSINHCCENGRVVAGKDATAEGIGHYMHGLLVTTMALPLDNPSMSLISIPALMSWEKFGNGRLPISRWRHYHEVNIESSSY